MMDCKKLIVSIFCIFLTATQSYGVDGFSVFSLGDSPSEVTNNGNRSCRFNQLKEDTRWLWKSYLECTNYRYKGVPTKLFFEFFDQELVKIYVVSKDIKDYLLIRHPLEGFLLPLKKKTKPNNVSNLADELIFKDQQYLIAEGHKLTHFFFNGSWEWEIVFEISDYDDTNQDEIESQLDDEEDNGMEGWKNFKYETPLEEIKALVQDQCAKVSLEISPNVVGRKNLICSEYLFIQQRITLTFSFVENLLVQIKLIFPVESYSSFLPLLKKKYGKPYRELEKNKLFYPFIDFPEKGVTLAHDPLEPEKIYLRYQKSGFEDKDELIQMKEKKNAEDEVKSKKEVILDNL